MKVIFKVTLAFNLKLCFYLLIETDRLKAVKMLKSLIQNEHQKILLSTGIGDGTVEIVDAMVAIGATDKDIIKAADGYSTLQIVLFDTRTLRGVDVTEQLAKSFDEPYDNFSPLWIKNQPNFDAIAAEDCANLIHMNAHRRSFSHSSNYL